ncbi:MAG: GvpL/GvpF family gas vesicle protein [Actinomycetia bacterium]|nr:GvpL/GvpF family gas vesicle protein [Actinomycetes bacterium]
MSEPGIYLFAVAVSERFGSRLAIPALPAEYGDVETIVMDDIVALGSAYCGPAITEIPQAEVVRHLMMHQQVIETAARRDYVLPVRLGTVIRDKAAVIQLLRAGSELIHDTSSRFEGHVEIDVAVTWELDQVLKEVSGDPEVLSAKEAVGAAPADQRSTLTLDVGRLVAAKLDERRACIQDTLLETLGPHVRDFQNNALVNDTLVCNTAFLIRAEDVDAFDSALRAVDADLAGRYNFRRVGPLPLYSFATLHVRELAQDRLEAARLLLKLPGDYDEATVDESFRALAVVLHPDSNPGDEAAADRFEQVARARADLVAACRNRGSDTAPGPVLYLSVERSLGRT